jgi:NADH-quinone oxidoreductase subunit H
MTPAEGALLPDLAMGGLFIVMAMGMLLGAGGLLTWVERKQSAVMSDRVGANRAYIRLPFTNVRLVWLGLFHGMADGLKLLLKENFTPRAHDLLGYRLAPFVAFAPVLLVFAVIPFGGMLDPGALVPALAPWFAGRTYPMQVASLDAGLLVVFAFGGFSIIGAMLAGWASENKFSLLGGLRAGSQMISYELVMALTVLGLVLVYGTVDLRGAVAHQSGTVGGWLPAWGIVYQPFGAFLFLTAAIAENKRIPFDLPEAESELVAGYFTEYSAMKLGLFMLSEYIQIAVVAALFATLFLGGYNLPWMTDAGFAFPWGVEVALPQAVRVPLQLATFLGKVALLCLVQIQIRWTLPRFRYDQMLGLSWRLLLPASLANLAVTVLVAWWQGGGR